MSRGFVSGVIWGGVIGAVGLAVASQVAPPPARPLPAPETLATPQADTLPDVAEAPVSPVMEAPVQPQAPASEPPQETALPAPMPEVGAAPAPGATDAEPVANAQTAETASPAPDPTAPATGVADLPATSGDAVAVPAAEPPDTTTSAGDAAATPTPSADLPAPASDLSPPPGSEFAKPLPDVDPVLPAPDAAVTTEATPAVTRPEPTEPGAPDTASAARPEPTPLDPTAPQAPAIEVAEPATLPGEVARAALPSETAQPGAPTAEPLPGATDLPPPPPLTPEEEALIAEPRIITPNPPLAAEAPAAPAPGLAEDESVTTNRLPRIGDAPAVAEEEALPPVRAFARPFENPQGKPLFSILLIDTGGPDLDREALAALPFPVSFVIDPLAPDAATAAAVYRKAGQEVLMLATGIPEGATASDLEVTFAAHAKALPEAVGLVDLPGAGFQADRTLSAEVATIVGAQGRGMVTHDRGLNAADQVARRQGLPATVIFRRLDGEGEETPAIRRYLDRAAFKAAQDGRVSVIGDTRAETVKALVEWSVEGRAAMVALAPVTATMGE